MSADANHAAIASFFDALAECFSAQDLTRIHALFQLPAMIVGPPGVYALGDAAQFDAFYGAMLDRLRSDRFAKSTYDNMSVKTVAPGLALAAMSWTRWRSDGSKLEEFGATYTLVQRDGAWKIVALVGHGPDTVPRLS